MKKKHFSQSIVELVLKEATEKSKLYEKGYIEGQKEFKMNIDEENLIKVI